MGEGESLKDFLFSEFLLGKLSSAPDLCVGNLLEQVRPVVPKLPIFGRFW